eukprot:18627_1
MEYFQTVSTTKVKTNNNNKTIDYVAYGGCCSSYGALNIHSMSNTIHVWQFRINQLRSTMVIGIDESNAKHVETSFYNGKTTMNYGYELYNCMKWNKGKHEQYANDFVRGDTVAMHLNLFDGTLSYAVNGDYCGVAYQNILKHKDVAYKMVIAIAGGIAGDSITLLSHKVVESTDGFIHSNEVEEQKDSQNDQSKSEAPIQSLNELQLNPILKQIEKMNARIDSLQHMFNDMESRINIMATQVNQEQKDDTIGNILKEIKFMKQRINELSSNSISQQHQKLKRWFDNDVKLPQYYDVFINNGIGDLSLAALIDKEVLKDLGITTIGHQMTILSKAKQLKEEDRAHKEG